MSCSGGFQGKCSECPDKQGCSKVTYPVINTVKTQGDTNMITAVAAKNMRWVYRPESETIHIQMTNTEKPYLNNRSYGMSFDIKLAHVLYHVLLSEADLIEKLNTEALGNTKSLSTDKPYTKGAIVVYANQDDSGKYKLSLLVYLGRSYKSTRFWISDEYADEYVTAAMFAMETGYVIDDDLAIKIRLASIDASSKPSAAD